jgi:O-antigen/teichoic acid export membrane protein
MSESAAATQEGLHRFHPLVQRLRIGTLAGLSQNLISILNSLLLVRVVLSHFSAQNSGTWLVFLSVGAYVSFLDFGIGTNLTRETAFLRQLPLPEAKQRLLALVLAARGVMLPIVGASLLILLIFGFLYFPKTDAININVTLTAWCIFALGAVLSIVASTLFAVVFGAGNLVADKLGRMVSQLFGLLGMLAVVFVSPDLRTLAGVWAAQNALLVFFAYRQFKLLNLSQGVDVQAVRTYQGILTRTMAYWGAIGLGNVLFFNLGSTILAIRSSLSTVPQFDIPWRLASILLAVVSVYISTTGPQLSGTYIQAEQRAEAGHAELKSAFYSVARNAVWFAGSAALLLVWLGPQLISLWTGGRVTSAPITCLLLAAVVLVETHTRVHMSLIGAIGHFVAAWTTLSLGAGAVVGAWILVPHFGVNGLLAALLCALILSNAWFAPWYTMRTLQFDTRAYIVLLSRPLFLITVLGFALFSLDHLNFLPEKILPVGAAVHLLVLGAACAALFLIDRRLTRRATSK